MNCGDDRPNLLGGKNWHLCEDDAVFAGKPRCEMALPQQTLGPFLAQSNLGRARTLDPQDEAVSEIVAELQGHHPVFRTLRREDQEDAGRTGHYAKPLHRARNHLLVIVGKHPRGELVVEEPDAGESLFRGNLGIEADEIRNAGGMEQAVSSLHLFHGPFERCTRLVLRDDNPLVDVAERPEVEVIGSLLRIARARRWASVGNRGHAPGDRS